MYKGAKNGAVCRARRRCGVPILLLPVLLTGCVVIPDYYQPGTDQPGQASAVVVEGFSVVTSRVDGASLGWEHVADHHILHLTPGTHEFEGVATNGSYRSSYRFSAAVEAGKKYRYVTGFSGYNMIVQLEEVRKK